MLKDLINSIIDEKEYLALNNAIILYDRLPKNVYGCLKLVEGINVILVKEALSDDKKKETILHELAHLELNHLYKMCNYPCYFRKNLEDEADEYIKFLKS